MTDPNRPLPPIIQEVFAEFIPLCRRIAGDLPYAIAASGSIGKGTWDSRSDVDFRLYTAEELSSLAARPGMWDEYKAAEARWKERGVTIDGIWPRSIKEIDRGIDEWTAGKANPVHLLWTIWGYHLLPDMYHQYIIEDPYGIIAGWKQRLSIYPPRLKAALLKKYTQSLRYWRTDYHYANKVERADPVFLAGMSSKLVHEIIQILFALNQTYFVGDGSNLTFAAKFAILPPDFAARVQTILYPQGVDAYQIQYQALAALIDDTLTLVDKS
jgi:hypothetical protein